MKMTTTELSYDQLEELSDRLTSKRQELTGLVQRLGEVTGTKHDCAILDVADSANLNEMRRRAASLIIQHEENLSEIDAAFARMKQKRYGISEATGEPIDYERLLVVPWARTGTNE
jgi:RNA polymerase-binding transcription factor DksA